VLFRPAPARCQRCHRAAALPGGESVRVTVTLSGPAPLGGAAIALSSDNSALAALPATVTVPADIAAITFSVDVSPVTSLTRVVFSASYGGVTRSATLAVALVKLAWLRLGQTRVPGRTEVVGAVMLNEPAPAGGVAVSLSSDRPEVASPPQRVRVEAGTRVAFFTVQTAALARATPVVMTAGLGGVRQEAVLEVLPAGSMCRNRRDAPGV
jgi:trimeric autotransporter adhesin